jgi:hypothetical protein
MTANALPAVLRVAGVSDQHPRKTDHYNPPFDLIG